jgi:branched-subunit amino acid transport protein
MSWELLVGLGVLTYGSRAAALALLPKVPPRLAAILDRMPSALFAGLAAHALVIPGGVLAEPPVLAAAAGALAVTPFRSVPICLAAGLAAYGLTVLIR